VSEVRLSSERVEPGLSPCEIALLKVEMDTSRCNVQVHPNGPRLFKIDWPHAHQILARYQGVEGYSDTMVRQQGTAWLLDPRSAVRARREVDLSVEEDLNDPPVLVAKTQGPARAV
jgi:hypothetical protein